MDQSAAPALSVIMTVYNGEAFLQEALHAIFNQTFNDFELVVVNNGSTDATQAILDAVTDDRLRVVQAPSHGSFGDGIRLAYQNARGRYIAVQDADDASLPDRFAKQVAALEADASVGLVSGAYQDMDDQGNLGAVHQPPCDAQGLIDTLQTNNPLAHSTYMYRRDAADQVGGYASEYAYGPDLALVIRLIKKGWGVKVLDSVVLKLRLHALQTSVVPEQTVTRARDVLYLFEESANLQGASPAARRKGRRANVKRALQYGLALLREKQRAQGLKHLLLGIVRHPLYGLAYLGYRMGVGLGLMRPRGS